MRSNSHAIEEMEKISRRSRATGCWLAMRNRHWSSIVVLSLIDGVIASDQLIRQIGVTIGEGTDSLLLHPGDHRAEGQQPLIQSG